jgi:hypothetical protein
MMRQQGVGLALVLIGVLVLSMACANEVDWGQVAPTPMEVQLITHHAMVLALTKEGVNHDDLLDIRMALVDAKAVFQFALKEGEDLEVVQSRYVAKLRPDIAPLVDLAVVILVGRTRVLIDQGKTDLAEEYITGTLNGAISGVDTVLGITGRMDA